MLEQLIGKQIFIPGHFSEPITVQSGSELDDTLILQVKTPGGELRETFVSKAEAEQILASQIQTDAAPVDGHSFFLFIEGARIKTAFAYDPHFAVSLSGVRPLPHQLEAVYERILPQVRLRFLLADDPGAGKTIMAGLLLKELKLRGVIERILILAPAPLTLQWQDELRGKFSETFEIVNSHFVKNQLAGNPWERFRQCIASIDFAKRDDVIPGILQADWDLVVIDEAHKCSARTQGDGLRQTARYSLAQQLSAIAERLLLLTATPHQGDADQFYNFLRLLDPDLFLSNELNPKIIQMRDSPWFLRRIKEELQDFDGRKLFKKRYPITVPFELSYPEKTLYNDVTQYINQYLGQTQGRKKGAVALARTVLQRRLASSLNAIFSSLQKRQRRFAQLLEDLEQLSPREQRERLIKLGKLADEEADSSDREEAELDDIAAESTVAEQLEQLRQELLALGKLAERSQQTIELGTETKLGALQDCLKRSEFDELKDGRGKLLIFTEHRDTLEYLQQNLQKWGYTTCAIHGGMNVRVRQAAQKEFQFDKQICVATEAAGEGINLQFCRLMINYDMPWNPNRLEQRMGRIHRIGQEGDVYIFNFVAANTVEGRVLERLLQKLEEIRQAMGDRVFDVIGQILQIDRIRFEDLLREASYSKAKEAEALEKIDGIDPQRWQALEEATGVALATSHIDLSQVRRNQNRDYVSEERRLMPRYVEVFFKQACQFLRVNLEVRADGLWRVAYLKEEFRSDRLQAVRRLGTPEKRYPKLTFYKEHLEAAIHQDAELLSPGHPLFAAIGERLETQLVDTISRGCARYIDVDARDPYRINFFIVRIAGQDGRGRETVLNARLYAVAEKAANASAPSLQLISADCLHDLTALPEAAPEDKPPKNSVPKNSAPPTAQEQQRVEQWLKVKVQKAMMDEERSRRARELQIRQEYLQQAMESSIREARLTWSKLAAKVAGGDDSYRVARDAAQKKARDLQERYKNKQHELDYLKIVRPGLVEYLGTALVRPAPAQFSAPARRDLEVEATAIAYAMDYERQRGWEPEDISNNNDGSGFDLRSIGPLDPATNVPQVRRIEVKGRAQAGLEVSLTPNEWRKAQQLGDSYWLYVVWGCKTEEPQLLTIQNPALAFAPEEVKEIQQVTRYIIGAEALQRRNSFRSGV